jgi:hypothetical protein
MKENALNLIQSWIDQSEKSVDVILRVDRFGSSDDVLGISEYSTLGTLVNHVGGLSVSNGIIRHFGGTNKYGLSIKDINKINNNFPELIPGILIIADDIFGGLFGINASTRGKTGNVFYLPPDSYLWEDLDLGHTAFLEWSINGDTDLFFEDYKLLETSNSIPFNKTLEFTPPLWIKSHLRTNRISQLIDSRKSHSVRAEIVNQLSKNYISTI